MPYARALDDLVHTLKALGAGAGARAIIAYRPRNVVEQRFARKCRREGLRVRRLDDDLIAPAFRGKGVYLLEVVAAGGAE